MIHVEGKKESNYPHDREIILFDRDAFQSLGNEGLRKVNKKYNILCPQVFVMECLAPDREPEQRKVLTERLRLIENSVVLTGNICISPVIDIPPGVEYDGILSSEQIARNCINGTSITIERVTPERLISYYSPRVNSFKNLVKTLTEACELNRSELTPSQLISRAQERSRRVLGIKFPTKELKNTIRKNKQIFGSQEPSHVAKEAQQTVESTPINPPIDRLKTFLDLTDRDIRMLLNQIQDRRRLTPENYPDLAYPIYIYYLRHYIIYARQYDTQHLDQSYVRDFRYLHYLNFCDLFITNESSTPHIVNSLSYSDIRQTPVIKVRELKEKL